MSRTSLTKQSEVILQGSSGLAIKSAHKQAEDVLDIRSNTLKDDSVFVPLGDRVAVKRIAEAELSTHGIVLPQSGQTPPAFGVVVGIGQGRYNLLGQLIPVRVQVGAVVMFGKYAGSPLPIFGTDSKDMLSLREEEIMGVIMSKQQAAQVCADADPEIAAVEQ